MTRLVGVSCLLLAACTDLGGQPGDGVTVGSTSFAATSTAVNCDGNNDLGEITMGLGQGAHIVLSPGTCVVAGTLEVTTDNVTIEGAGPDVTVIEFTASTEVTTLFKFESSNPAQALNNCTLKNLGIQTDIENDQDKTAVYIHDARNFFMENVKIGPWDSESSVNPTVGIEVRGRDLGLFRKLDITADIPLKIGLNTGPPIECPANSGVFLNLRDCTKDLDHHHFEDLTLTSNVAPKPVVKVESGAVLRNITFDGYQSWNNGGLSWLDLSTVARRHSNHVRIGNLLASNLCSDECNEFVIHIEKTTSPNPPGEPIPAQLDDLLVEFSKTASRDIGVPLDEGPEWRGIRTRGVARTVLRQVVYEGRQTTPNSIIPAPIEDP
jgi:hypothetical protein